jgi:hypothetical protein
MDPIIDIQPLSLRRRTVLAGAGALLARPRFAAASRLPEIISPESIKAIKDGLHASMQFGAFPFHGSGLLPGSEAFPVLSAQSLATGATQLAQYETKLRSVLRSNLAKHLPAWRRLFDLGSAARTGDAQRDEITFSALQRIVEIKRETILNSVRRRAPDGKAIINIGKKDLPITIDMDEYAAMPLHQLQDRYQSMVVPRIKPSPDAAEHTRLDAVDAAAAEQDIRRIARSAGIPVETAHALTDFQFNLFTYEGESRFMAYHGFSTILHPDFLKHQDQLRLLAEGDNVIRKLVGTTWHNMNSFAMHSSFYTQDHKPGRGIPLLSTFMTERLAPLTAEIFAEEFPRAFAGADYDPEAAKLPGLYPQLQERLAEDQQRTLQGLGKNNWSIHLPSQLNVPYGQSWDFISRPPPQPIHYAPELRRSGENPQPSLADGNELLSRAVSSVAGRIDTASDAATAVPEIAIPGPAPAPMALLERAETFSPLAVDAFAPREPDAVSRGPAKLDAAAPRP